MKSKIQSPDGRIIQNPEYGKQYYLKNKERRRAAVKLRLEKQKILKESEKSKIMSTIHPLLRTKGFKPRKGTIGICKYCNKNFYVTPCELSIKKYCSRECSKLGQRTSVTLICKTCGKQYLKHLSGIKWQKIRGFESNYCSNECKRGKRGELNPLWKGGKKYNQQERKRPEYMAWRKIVFERDGYKCQIPSCACEDHYVEPHHIKKWNDHPDLRYDPNNGITLCKNHHYKTRKREHLLEEYFLELLKNKPIIDKNLVIELSTTFEELIPKKHPKIKKIKKIRIHRGFRAKLTWEQVEDIKKRHLSGENSTEIARSYGVDATTICRIVNGKRRLKPNLLQSWENLPQRQANGTRAVESQPESKELPRPQMEPAS